MKSWLCYLGENTWGTARSMLYVQFLNFLASLLFFFAVSVISYSTHKINLRRVSVRLFPWLSPLSYDSNADSRFMMLASLLSPSFLPTLPSNNHSWYSGVICLTRERCCGGLEVMIHASEDNEIQGDGEEIAQKKKNLLHDFMIFLTRFYFPLHLPTSLTWRLIHFNQSSAYLLQTFAHLTRWENEEELWMTEEVAQLDETWGTMVGEFEVVKTETFN